MGFWGTLGKIGAAVGAGVAAPLTGGASLASLPTILGAGSAALGAISQGKANNRGAEFAGQLDLERLLMDRDQQTFNNQITREQEGRASGNDAWRRLMAAQRVLSPGAKPQLSPYSIAPRMATGAERQGADAMTQEVMARLMGGNPIPEVQARPMNVDPKLLKPGFWESLAGYGSLGAGVLGRMGGTSSPIPSTSMARLLTAGPGNVRA